MNRRGMAEMAARAAAVAVPIVCALYAITHQGSIFVGGLTWLVVLAAVVGGYGAVAEHLVGTTVDLGLRMAWGGAAYLAIAGMFLAIGWLTHTVLTVLVIVGLVGYGWRQVTAPRPALLELGRLGALIRSRPLVAIFFAMLVALAAVNIAGSVAKVDGNTYDDDIAYTAFIKRTLDVGNIDEPFSFRRISAYGGQTSLGALAAVRGTLANIYLVDGGLFQLIALLLVVGLARTRPPRSQRPPATADPDDASTDLVLLGILGLVLVLLPNTSINTASHWTGVVLFLALYRTVVATARPDAPATRLFVMAGVLAAGACTLRQNYIPVAVLFPLAVLVARLGRTPRQTFRAERKLWLATVVGGVAALLPYLIASYRSNHTFLYPFWPGTFNPAIQLKPTVFSAWQEVQWFVKVLLEPDPIRVFLIVLAVIAVARDTRPGRPLTALTIASTVGFVLLVHNFPLSDAPNMWRYAIGYLVALFVIIVVEASASGLRTRDDDAGVRVPLLGRVILLVALLIQLALTARGTATKFSGVAADIDHARVADRHPQRGHDIELTYGRLQLAVPPGATLAVLLDEPFYLDYARNPIINLDTPGFASYAPGMPSFRGPGAVAAYFRAHGIRYLAFVRSDASRYFYRREFWLRRLLTDTELWRILGAYMVDCIDNFAAIATTHPVLFEHDGMVLVDLGGAP